MDTSESSLLEQIRQQCQDNHWFGPPSLKPHRAAWRSPYRPHAHGFVFPPATEEQVQQTERILGVSIPSLLRTLYLQLANGGFGPGAGIRGTLEGYGMPGTFEALNDETMVKNHRTAQSLLDWSSLADHWVPSPDDASLQLLLPYDAWPKELLPLCDLGCQMEACLHVNGQMYLCWASSYDGLAGFSTLDMNLKRWLSLWLQTGLPPTSPRP